MSMKRTASPMPVCLSPILVGERSDRFKIGPRFWARTYTVACGQCIRCRVRKKRSWTGRVLLEASEQLAKGRPAGRVLTLTYAPGNDPGVLLKNDVDAFLRRYVVAHGSARFLYSGEYGEIEGRPHWHVILFGHQSLR